MTSSEDRCILCDDWKAYRDELCYECFVNEGESHTACGAAIPFDCVACISCNPDQ